MIPCYYFLWGCLQDRVYRTAPLALQEMQAEIEAVAEKITGGMLRDAVDNFEARI
jgi:hypothetical protein